MLKRIAGIVLVFLCTTVAWFFLAGTVQFRTERQDNKLRAAVGRIWGEPLKQTAPAFWYETQSTEKVTTRTADALTTEEKVLTHRHDVGLEGSAVRADLCYEPRRKGLLWYSTYRVRFDAEYRASNPTSEARTLYFAFPLPSPGAVYDGFEMKVNGRPVASPERRGESMGTSATVPPGGRMDVRVSYVTQGLDEWWYRFGEGSVAQVRDFSLEVRTDFDGFDFPSDAVSPTQKRREGSGWVLNWTYANLLSGVQPGLALPKRLNPGPWVSQVTFAAPVSLFLFFFLLFILTTRREIPLHPMHYFFLAAAFFSFHLLMAYLVDHAALWASFLIASSTSLFLTVTYIRAAVSPRFAFLEAGLGQVVYQVLFSATFFLEAYTGLSITVLCVLTLFAVMQYTARVDWAAAFAGKAKNRPEA
jgi:hypothetical protein